MDIIIILIITWSAWRGYKTGLVGGVARLLGILAGLGAALCYYRPLAVYIDHRWQISSYIQNWFSLPRLGKEDLYKDIQLYGELRPIDLLSGSLQDLGQSVSRLLASGILEIVSFIFIFIVVSRLVYLAGELLARLASVSFLGPADRLGGVAFGLARGVLAIMILLALLVSLQWPSALFSSGGNPYWLSLALDNSLLAREFINAVNFFNIDFPGFSDT